MNWWNKLKVKSVEIFFKATSWFDRGDIPEWQKKLVFALVLTIGITVGGALALFLGWQFLCFMFWLCAFHPWIGWPLAIFLAVLAIVLLFIFEIIET